MTGLERLINKYIWRMDSGIPEIIVRPGALVFRYNSRKKYTTIPWSEITDTERERTGSISRLFPS